MKDGWYYKSIGQVMGPVAFETLAELARDELVHATDEVRRGPDGLWEPAESIVGLFPEKAGAVAESPAELEVAEDLADLDFRFGSASIPESELPTADDLPPLAPSTPLPPPRLVLKAPVPVPPPAPPPAEPVSSDADTIHDFGTDETRVKNPPAKAERPAASAPEAVSKLSEPAKSPAGKKTSAPAPTPVADSTPRPAPPKPAPSPTDAAVAPRPPRGRRLVETLREHRKLLIVAALVGLAGAWFFMPRGEKDAPHVKTATRLYEEFCKLRVRGAPPAEWAAWVQKSKAESEAILAEFKRRPGAPGTVRANLTRAFSEGFTPMIELMQNKTGSEPESVYVTGVNKAIVAIDPKAPRLIMPGPTDVLGPTAEQLRQAGQATPEGAQPDK